MNKQLYLIIFLFGCNFCNSQNLVPNGDFEQYSSCPTWWTQIDSALDWFNPAVFPGNGGSPDYYNQCATTGSYVDVPNMAGGYQLAHSGGAFAGIGLWYQTAGTTREYLEVKLVSPLIAGSCYHFEMYVNLANHCKYTTSDIGVYFSDTLVGGINNADNLPFIPQINNVFGNNFDTLNWVLVNGDYNAMGGENYLIIGNFKHDSNTVTLFINNFAPQPVAYCFIDDVSLMLCTTGINESNDIANKDIYPNPFNDKINIATKGNELLEVSLYDVTSRKIFNHSFINSTTINTEQLAKGIYLYEVRNKSGVIKQGKVVKD